MSNTDSGRMPNTDPPRELRIKKYSNRRFYDATRSCHVTLADLHDLIRAGHELVIVDSKTNEDITHQVLTQILLEREAPKLEIFPANILHQIIRTQQQMLGNVVEQFFQQALANYRASQERWASFLSNVLGGGGAAPNPLEWTRAMLDTWTPRPAPGAGAPATPPELTPAPQTPEPAPGSRPSPENTAEELRELREQVASLSRRLRSAERGTPRKRGR